jgi:1,4-dihydroxy-2-naphthoate octaprenyltransferase
MKSSIQDWIEAARPRTLPLSVSGILIGSAMAFKENKWSVHVFIFGLLTTLLYQIISNLANDLGDSLKGTDNANRLGPARSIQKGAITQKQMKTAIWLVCILAGISSVILIVLGTKGMGRAGLYFYGFLASTCILAAITYTIGKKAYGYFGMGDVMVIIFFGFVTVCGIYPMHTKFFSWETLFPAVGIGLLSVAVLHLNNMRDRVNDASFGKRTLAVIMGEVWSKIYHFLLILVGMGCLIIWMIGCQSHLIFIGGIPLIFLLFHLRRVWAAKQATDFDPELKVVSLSTFAFSLLTSMVLFFTQ